MAVIESKGDGFSLFNGVKLPSLPEITNEWLEENLEYPEDWGMTEWPDFKYSAINTFEGLAFISARPIFIFTPKRDNPDFKRLAVEWLEDVYDTLWFWFDGDGWVFYYTDTGAESQIVNGYTVWSNHDLITDFDGTTYLAGSDPIPLDGMNVIEWDGDTTGLSVGNGGSGWYVVAENARVDTAKEYVRTLSDGTFATNVWSDDGDYYGAKTARFYKIGTVEFRSASAAYNSLLAYYPAEEVTTIDYTITYDTLYGTAPTSKTITVNEGESYTLTADDLPTLSRYDIGGKYTYFTAWATQQFKGERIGVGYEISGDITLHAVWSLKHTITFHTEHGTVPEPLIVTAYSDYFFEAVVNGKNLPVLEAEGYTFKGWSDTKDGSYIGNGFVISNSTNLYAVWEKVVEPEIAVYQSNGNAWVKKDLHETEGETQTYDYNGTKLPVLPEWDKETYPYAMIYLDFNRTLLVFTNEISYGEYDYFAKHAIFVPTGSLIYKMKNNEWYYYETTTDSSDYVFHVGGTTTEHRVIWANCDIIAEDGSVFLPPSDPVPYYGFILYDYNGITAPDINTIWVDKEKYPYVAMGRTGSVESYTPYLYMLPSKNVCVETSEYSGDSLVVSGDSGFEATGSYYMGLSRYYDSLGWWSREGEQGLYGGLPPIWANFDVYREDGTLYLSASDPVPDPIPVGGAEWKKKRVTEAYQEQDGKWVKIVLSGDSLPAVGTPLEDCTWEQISAISAAGRAEEYFSVGDTKSVHLKGTVGTLELDTTLYVYILGFDHNSEIEGKGITFGTFKTADGIDVALIDENYNSNKNDGTKTFNVQHWGNYNYGGWAGCDMRYDILGSTDVQPSGYGAQSASGRTGNNPSATCTSNPVANTLMAALPADLRAVLKPITKYTDNVAGGSGSVEANVTATIDYLPLLAEYEIFGRRKNANGYEKNKQEQYAYYTAGNSKKKYRHSVTGSTCYWWERSPSCHFKSIYFCIVSTDDSADSSGTPYTYDVDYSYGVAPIFLV